MGSVSLPGCEIADDFTAALGDQTEARLAAALQYRSSGSCPTEAAVSNSGQNRAQSQFNGPLTVDTPKPAWLENRMM